MADKTAPVVESGDPTTTNLTASPRNPRKKLMVLMIVGLLLTAGGGGFYFYRASAAAASKEVKSKKTRNEKKPPKEQDEDEPEKAAKAEDDESKSEKSVDRELPNDEDVKQVIELQPFIVNLADQNDSRYLRMTVSLGLGKAAGEEKPDPLFTTRVRNALLSVLTTKTSKDVLTTEGKVKLRKELLHAAQSVVEEPEVHAIYITDFIVQL